MAGPIDLAHALRGGKRTHLSEQGAAIRTSGWGLDQLLHPNRSGLNAALRAGQAGAPSIGSQVGNLIEQAPSGFLNFGKGVATDPVAAGTAGALGGASVAGPPGALIGGLGGLAVGTIGYGIRSLFDDNAGALDTTKQLGESFQRTGSDLIHPTHFARASKRGEIIAKIVEDLANASMVASAAGGGLNAAAGGALKEATAGEAGARAAEQTAAQAVHDVEMHTAAANVPGISELARANSLTEAAKAQGAADFASEFARNARAEAAAAGAKAPSGTLGLYKALRGAADLGNKGAMLPAKPFELAGKGLKAAIGSDYAAKAGEWSLGKLQPATQAFLANHEGAQAFADTVGQLRDFTRSKLASHGEKSSVSGQLHHGVIQARAEAGRVYQLHNALEKAVPDPIEQQVGNILATGVPEVLDHISRSPGATPQIIEDLVGHLTDHGKKEFTGLTPEALSLALDYLHGRVTDPEVVNRIGIAQQYSHEINQGILEPDFLRARGVAPDVMRDPAQAGPILADRAWQVHGDEPNPQAIEALHADHARQLEAQGRQLEEARKVLERVVGKEEHPAEQRSAPTRSIKEDQLAATNAAHALLGGAPEVVDALFPGLKGMDENQAVREVADAIAQIRTEAAKTPGIWDQMPAALREVVDQQTWSGPKPIVGNLAGVSQLIGQGRQEGAAAALTGVAEKLGNAAETARARGDEASAVAAEKVQTQIVRSVEKINRATDRVARRVEDLRRAQERVRDRVGTETDYAVQKATKRLKGEIVRTRQTLRKEMMKASDELLYDVARTIGGWPEATLAVGRAGEDIARMVSDELTSNLLKSPPSAIGHYANGGRLTWDEVIYAWGEKRGMGDASGNGVDMAAAAEELANQINGAAQLRSAAKGLIKNGVNVEDTFAVHNLESALSQLGYTGPEIAETMTMLAGGVKTALDALLAEEPKASAFTPEVSAKVNQAIQDRFDVEQNGGTPGPWPTWSKDNPAGLTPFERTVADYVIAELKQGNAERQVERVTAKQIDALIKPAVKAATEQGRGAGLAQGATLAGNRAETATRAAGRNADARLAGGVSKIAGPAFKEGERAGKVAKDIANAARRVGIEERVMQRLTERQQREIAAAEADLRNAPARYRPLIASARLHASYLEKLRARAEADVPGSGAEFDQIIADLPVTLSKAVEQGYNPEFRIGGEVQKIRTPGKSSEGYIPQLRKGGETKERVAMAMPANAAEEAKFAAQRITDYVRNETVHAIQGRFAVAPAQVIGQTPDQVGIDVSALAAAATPEARAAALDVIDKAAADQGLAVLHSPTGEVGFIPTELTKGDALIAAMHDQGYVPWDPGQIFNKPTKAATNLDTSFVSEAVWDRFVKQVGPAGNFEKAIRTFVDKPMRLWKDQVLALSPRWHVNNIIGGIVTATAGGGIHPLTYIQNFSKGVEIMRAFSDPAKLAALAEKDPELAAIAAELSPELHQGTPSAALEDAGPRFGDKVQVNAPSRSKTVNRYKALTNKSYHMNGFVDDANRLAVFLTERDRLTKTQLVEHLGKHHELRDVLASGGEKALRDEVAIRLSLKTVGDFTRLSPMERDVVKRFFPFYPWMRHITQLALRMPITAPMRVAWLLHLSAVFGEPSEFPFLQGYLPVTGKPGDAARGYIHTGRVNPFADVTYGTGGPADFSLSNLPAQIASQVSPALSEPLAQLTGLDLRKWAQTSRPAGSGNFDAYGRSTFSPLIDSPMESLSHLTGLLPGARVLRSAFDALEYGGKLPLRYDNGQVIKSQGNPLFTDRPWYGPATDLLGVPVSREKIDVSQLRGKRDERLRRAFASRARYNGAGTASTGAVLPAWGSGR